MSKPSTHENDRSRLPASWPLLAIMALMLAASVVSVQVVSWTRAYTSGLALWIAGQHRAVYELRDYAATGDDVHYHRFRQELAVPLGDHVARLEMQKPSPDRRVIEQGLVQGRNASEDIPGIIHLFSLFKYHPLMNRAVDLWTQADVVVLELARTGELIHAEFAVAKPDSTRIGELAEYVDSLHKRVGPLTAEFGSTLGEASRQIVLLLLVVMPLFALTMVAVGAAVFRMLGRRAERATHALQELTGRLEHQATHDSLTGLANRRRFETLLAAAIEARQRSGDRAALLYFDLDQFKVVNDTCGHAAGDELLKQVAWRVQRMAGEGGSMARLGGDEFALLLSRCGEDAAVQLAERIRAQLSEQRFYWNGKTFAVSASIGVLELDEGVPNVAEALSAADQACYLAKDNGRDRVWLYRPDDAEVRARLGELNWVDRLQAALDNDGFELVAQEIRPVGWNARGRSQPPRPARRFELLLRMTAPDGQMVAPMAFIPAAERYGLMPRIDRWVIARACRELGSLRASGVAPPVCMVNISGASASDPGLADYLAQCLRENDLPGSLLGIELTETVAVGNLSTCAQLMTRLRELGCLIALDDFGTGMSSFSYLRNLPIDLLKIDRAFIRNVATDAIDHALVETIHRIGGIMGMRTVAEGVETEEVLATLALIGVDFAQGSHIRRPVPLVQMLQAGAGGEEALVRRVAAPLPAALP